jgi:hypothetical protein
MSQNIEQTATDTAATERWPADLIAFKWANTLSQGEQDVLLASNLKSLQQRINAALRQREEEVRAECAKVADDHQTYQHRFEKVLCYGNCAQVIAATIRRDDAAQEGEQPKREE